MKDKFQFRRFFTYFRYDLVQMWRVHGRTLLIIACLGVLSYVLNILFNLIFTQSWEPQGTAFRVSMIVVAYTILELFMARVYGQLTERKAGSAWLMIPASRLEKTVSMLLTVNIVIPVLFLAVYLSLDGILSLADPTFGPSLAVTAGQFLSQAKDGLGEVMLDSPITVSGASLVGLLILGNAVNFTFFLLCGLCFKKNKIGGALLVIFLLSVVLSILGAMAILPNVSDLESLGEQEAIVTATRFLNGLVIGSCVVLAGLVWGVWRRVKTLQH